MMPPMYPVYRLIEDARASTPDLQPPSRPGRATMLRTYGKSLTAFAIAVLTAISTAVSAGHFGPVEKVQVAVAVASAAAVYLVPAFPQYPAAKTVIAALMAALNLAASLLASKHGLSDADWINLMIAALGVIGVHAAPAVSLAKSANQAA